ncbi:hypothetical protein BC833DRAFT_603546 [Globomyces pollinis-pini]|nr:hypothetical protein BC833DRAFT_603546 [Globomyces pollinis-pini]
MNSKLGKSYSALEDMFIDRSNSDEMLVCEILPNLETSPKQILGPGTSLWAASPLMYLKYLYLFVDSMVQDEFDNPRHQLAVHGNLPQDVIPTIHASVIGSPIREMVSRYGASTPCYLLRINLDIDSLPMGDFKSILMLETPLLSSISCTTSIFSYGDKILETREVQNSLRYQDSSNLYKFDFVKDYWTAFLNGFQYLENYFEESRVAIQSLTMIQVFGTSDIDQDIPLLCLAYEFSVGDGSVNIQQIIETDLEL